jgi:D-glycero-D-manno-heptose 1,7-bisphosphate phosphatase
MPPPRPPRPAIFLDRDDTLCRNADLPDHAWGDATPGDLLDPAHVHAMPGVAPALEKLRKAGFAIVIITNQGGIARSHGHIPDIDACHDALRAQLPLSPPDRAPHPIAHTLIDACYSAPHHPSGTNSRFADDHPWRKPGPGMVLAAARELHLDLAHSWMVGDKQRDLDAAISAGIDPARTIQVSETGPTPDLPAAVEKILAAIAPKHPVHAERITLRCLDEHKHPLQSPRTRATVAAAARGLAERSGLQLLDLTLTDDSVTATIATHRLAAMAFMNDLRRHTNHWHTQSQGTPLWPE